MEAVLQSYERGENDEFILPTVVIEDGVSAAVVDDGDSVIFYNFRSNTPERCPVPSAAMSLTALTRTPETDDLYLADYDATIPNKEVAFEKEAMTNTFGEWLAANGLKQSRIADVENRLFFKNKKNDRRQERWNGKLI